MMVQISEPFHYKNKLHTIYWSDFFFILNNQALIFDINKCLILIRHKKWISVVECLSVLDVLMSLSTFSRGGELCRPEFVTPDEETQVSFVEITVKTTIFFL